MKQLFLLRGLPGAGKSTLAKALSFGIESVVHEADSYFKVLRDPETGQLIDRHNPDGVYEFDSRFIANAHADCLNSTRESMRAGLPRVLVANTFTQYWEMDKYFRLAKEYGYDIYSLIVENRHNGINSHAVDAKTLQNMEARFDVRLI